MQLTNNGALTCLFLFKAFELDPSMYTILQNRRMWWREAPPPSNIFKWKTNQGKYMYHFKENLWEIQNELK